MKGLILVTEFKLKSVFTDYSEREDRIRLVCELQKGAFVIVWLSQRFITLIVDAIFKTFKKDIEKTFLSEKIQWNAKTAIAVKKDNAFSSNKIIVNGGEWLADSVTITRCNSKTAVIVLRCSAEKHVEWTLSIDNLRKWLEILSNLFATAGWFYNRWPAWMQFGLQENELTAAVWN